MDCKADLASCNAVVIAAENSNSGSDNPDLAGNDIEGCWVDSYGRGVGTPVEGCAAGLQEDAGLCYPYCDPGFSGIGPVCYQDCPSDFGDSLFHCLKPATYGRGAGWIDKANCELKEG